VTDLTLPLSADTIASQLELAVGDILLADQLHKAAGPAEESVLLLTEQLYEDTDITAQPESEEVLVISEMRAKLDGIWSGIRRWSKDVFSKSVNWIEALAKECLDLASQIGKDVADLLSRLHRRVMRWIISSAITPKLTIGTSDGSVVLSPKSVKYEASLKAAPALAALDLAGVISVLTGMMSMVLKVDVTYEVLK
jgi:hypothetical protein